MVLLRQSHPRVAQNETSPSSCDRASFGRGETTCPEVRAWTNGKLLPSEHILLLRTLTRFLACTKYAQRGPKVCLQFRTHHSGLFFPCRQRCHNGPLAGQDWRSCFSDTSEGFSMQHRAVTSIRTGQRGGGAHILGADTHCGGVSGRSADCCKKHLAVDSPSDCRTTKQCACISNG